MKSNLTLIPMVVLLIGLIIGCGAPPQPPVRVSEGPRVVTMEIDSRDYNEIAKYVYDSLARSGRIDDDGVVALGPVSVDPDRDLWFDARRLQEKIQVHAQRAGLIEFTFAVDALAGDSAADERYSIMELQWIKEDTVDRELLRTVGGLAEIDYLLFGRLSSQTTSKEVDDDEWMTEITYTYNWKLGNCESGILVWTDEYELTKSSLDD